MEATAERRARRGGGWPAESKVGRRGGGWQTDDEVGRRVEVGWRRRQGGEEVWRWRARSGGGWPAENKVGSHGGGLEAAAVRREHAEGKVREAGKT
ncbi:hypothetical protein GUJ93_ZPchr0009g1081 [Zizania palustris]|uniref:Uncharacterized protein n=1 Tax=Zizania palustris TaxID=103762 RepID=A0A8J5RIY9_ZIZPA|nr:hypothetical protein GUJ93_ZPchr0009g1081 [Zizania palustris]